MDDLLFESYEPSFEALSIIYDSVDYELDTFKSYVHLGYLIESCASDDIIMEGVSDVFSSIVNAIRKFIQKVKEFFKKALLYITSAYQDLDKVAAQVKKVMSGKTINFTINGYKFTTLEKQGPDVSEFRRIVDEYNSDMESVQKMKKAEITASIKEWLREENLDKLRGKTLGVSGNIDEDNFRDEIRKYYRNDTLDAEDFTVTTEMVNEIINHAKKLEDTKKSSIKDRDNLVSLLERTEKFFDRTIYTYYKGSDKTIDVSKIEVDTDTGKMTKTRNDVSASTGTADVISTYATYKSKQVNIIAGMINTVASERVITLKDQIKQERTILRKCLFNETDESKSSEVDESVQVFSDAGEYRGMEYSSLMVESQIPICKMYNDLEKLVLLEEAKYILNSVNNGEISIYMEADGVSNFGKKVKNAVLEVIESICKMFREKAIGEVKKYKPWLDEIKDGLAEKAKAKEGISISNFLDTDYQKIATTLEQAVSNAYKSTDYTNVSFINPILSDVKGLEDLKSPDNRSLLLNYFRTGKPTEKMVTVVKSGTEIASKLDSIIGYIEKYDDAVVKAVEKIKKTIADSTEAFTVTESMITGSTYLDLISSPICESDMVLCKDYNEWFKPVTESITLLEADGIGGKAEGIGGDSKPNANSDVNSSVKNSANATKGETKEGEEAKNVTSAQAVDKNGVPESKTDNSKVAYKKAIDSFFQRALSLYLKAREEQFISYKNILIAIDGRSPQFDKSGIYISKADKEKAKEEENKESETVTKAEDNTKQKSKPLKGKKNKKKKK